MFGVIECNDKCDNINTESSHKMKEEHERIVENKVYYDVIDK